MRLQLATPSPREVHACADSQQKFATDFVAAWNKVAVYLRTQVHDRFWMFNERGELIIAKLSDTRYSEIDRAKVIEPSHFAIGRDVVWSAPAFASREAFIRDDHECICVDLAQEAQEAAHRDSSTPPGKTTFPIHYPFDAPDSVSPRRRDEPARRQTVPPTNGDKR